MARHELSAAMPQWQSFIFGVACVACRRCGCRMITKVGRTTPMLICTDCGLPMDQRETATLSRQRLSGAFALLAMALVAGAMVLLASVNEMRRARELEAAPGSQTEASAEEGSQEERILMEPSTLMEPNRRSPQRVGTTAEPGLGSRAPSKQALTGSGSGRDAAQPPAATRRQPSATPAGSGQ